MKNVAILRRRLLKITDKFAINVCANSIASQSKTLCKTIVLNKVISYKHDGKTGLDRRFMWES